MSVNESENDFLQIPKTESRHSEDHKLIPPIVHCCWKEKLVVAWDLQENCLYWHCVSCNQWIFPIEFPYRLQRNEQRDELVDLILNTLLACSRREGWQQIPQSWLEGMVSAILKRCLEKGFPEEEIREMVEASLRFKRYDK